MALPVFDRLEGTNYKGLWYAWRDHGPMISMPLLDNHVMKSVTPKAERGLMSNYKKLQDLRKE